MALDRKYRLEEFSSVFDLRDSEGKPYLLIGGQAVNYRAERYLTTIRSSNGYSPSRARTSTSRATKVMSNAWSSS